MEFVCKVLIILGCSFGRLYSLDSPDLPTPSLPSMYTFGCFMVSCGVLLLLMVSWIRLMQQLLFNNYFWKENTTTSN